MDKPSRNLIQKATQDARHLLEAEFSRHMEQMFREDVLEFEAGLVRSSYKSIPAPCSLNHAFRSR
jgi:hypothetical protein